MITRAADQQARGEYQSAIAAYYAVVHRFRAGEYAATALARIADLQFNALKDYTGAAKTCEELLARPHVDPQTVCQAAALLTSGLAEKAGLPSLLVKAYRAMREACPGSLNRSAFYSGLISSYAASGDFARAGKEADAMLAECSGEPGLRVEVQNLIARLEASSSGAPLAAKLRGRLGSIPEDIVPDSRMYKAYRELVAAKDFADAVAKAETMAKSFPQGYYLTLALREAQSIALNELKAPRQHRDLCRLWVMAMPGEDERGSLAEAITSWSRASATLKDLAGTREAGDYALAKFPDSGATDDALITAIRLQCQNGPFWTDNPQMAETLARVRLILRHYPGGTAALEAKWFEQRLVKIMRLNQTWAKNVTGKPREGQPRVAGAERGGTLLASRLVRHPTRPDPAAIPDSILIGSEALPIRPTDLEEGIQVAWPKERGMVMSVDGVPVAEMAFVKVEADGAGIPARLRSRAESRGKVTETWSLDNPAMDLLVEYSTVSAPTALRMRLAAVNRSNLSATACVAVEMRLKQTLDRAILFDFTKAPYLEFAYGKDGMSAVSFTAEKDVNFQKGLYGYPNRKTVYNGWGTAELCNPLEAKDPMRSTLYLPIVSLYNAARGGLVAWCDPRSPVGFDGNPDRLRLQHTFFLLPRKGAIDDGFEPGDGTGPWPYLLYLGYSRKPAWDELYARRYMPTAPDLRGGHKSRFKPGILGTVRTSEQSLPIERRLGMSVNTALSGGLSITYSGPDWITRAELEWARKNGLTYCALDGTIGMTIQVDKSQGIPGREPQWVTERYESSLIKDKSGRTQWCWEGSFANPSPSFPFGQDRVNALKDLFKLPVGGFWVDLYLTHGGSDWAHPVDAMPFYPMHRAYYEYLSAVAQQAHKRGLNFFAINAPWPSCLVGKYADCMTFDAYVSLSLMMRTYGELTGVSTHLLADFMANTPPSDTLTALKKVVSEAMAFGVINAPYSHTQYLLPDNTRFTPQQKEDLLQVYERHYRLAYDIGRAKLVKGSSTDGRPGPFLYYRGADGTGYITVLNPFVETRQFDLPLELNPLGLAQAGALRGAIWDIDRGMGPKTSLSPGTSTLQLTVPPGRLFVIVLTPGRTGAARPITERGLRPADSTRAEASPHSNAKPVNFPSLSKGNEAPL